MMIERIEPRISLNQLTEYLTTNSTGRKNIIKQQKSPRSYQVIYYRDAQDAIQRFIAEGMSTEEILVSKLDDIYARSGRNSYEQTRQLNNAAAIESFLELYPAIDLGGLRPSVAPDDQPKLRIRGVDISVRPEIILTGHDGCHSAVIGGIKLYLIKRAKARLENELGKYPTAILFDYLARYDRSRKPIRESCIVVDVFGRQQFCAPRYHKRIMSDVAVVCEEIAAWWDHL